MRDGCKPGAVGARLSRRTFLRGAVLGMATVVPSIGMWAGRRSNPYASFDREMTAFMEARRVPGGALAVVWRGRLVYAAGYGWADRATRAPVRPDSLFRIASLSKPVTAAAVFKLVEEGRLSLEDRVAGWLGWDGLGGDEAPRDARWHRITVEQLLQHAGGWDRELTMDPMFQSRAIARELGISSPPLPRDIIRYMLRRPLDFDPGTRMAYSNFGYSLLGRVIEAAGGEGYERWVRRRVLAPIGIREMAIGCSLEPGRREREVHYSMRGGERVPTVFGGWEEAGGLGQGHRVPVPYGGFFLEAMDAHGGWVGSVIDLARFLVAVEGWAGAPRLLRPEAVRRMEASPGWVGSEADVYYACGWSVRRVGGDGRRNQWHTGSLPGTFALMVRRWDGLGWVALFNQRSEDPGLPDGEIDRGLHRAADAVEEWVEANSFGEWER